MSIDTLPTDVQKSAEDSGLSDIGLPLNYDLRWAYLISLLIALLTAVASLAAILLPDLIYPTAELQRAFLANDIVNLFIGLPILFISMWLARRKKLIGLLFWPGALFYGLYNYLTYLFGVPFNFLYPLYLVIVTFSIYTTIGLAAAVDGQALKARLDGHVPRRLAGGILIGFGSAFALRVIWLMAAAIASHSVIAGPELGLLVADFLFSGALLLGGLLVVAAPGFGLCGRHRTALSNQYAFHWLDRHPDLGAIIERRPVPPGRYSRRLAHGLDLLDSLYPFCARRAQVMIARNPLCLIENTPAFC